MVKKQQSLFLDEEVIKRVEEDSKEQQRSKSYVVNDKLKKVYEE